MTVKTVYSSVVRPGLRQRISWLNSVRKLLKTCAMVDYKPGVEGEAVITIYPKKEAS